MPGFIRRFSYDPGEEVITQIEGVSILDLTPPGPIEGIGVGTACLVGEFPDMRQAVTVSSTGGVTSNIVPLEVVSSADLIDKFGGFDETLGDFGNSEGNGFTALRSKRFSRLIIAPINLASNFGFRFWRYLPLSVSQTDPTSIVPVQGASIVAGREFQTVAGARCRIAAKTIFTAYDVLQSGIGGAIAAAAGATTQNFTVAGATFHLTDRWSGGVGIKKGDIIVLGNNNNGALEPLPAGGSLGAGTYRVAADATSAAPTILVLERLDGQSFAFVDAANVPFRIHVSSDADSAPVMVIGATTPGGYKASETGGYSIPIRLLTDDAGGLVDGVWPADTEILPIDAPDSLTGSSWDPLSGLTGRTHITGTAAYTTLIHRANAVAGAGIDALYATAIAATISDLYPVSDINLIWAARTSSTIRNSLYANASQASHVSKGRIAVIRPNLEVVSKSSVLGSTSPGVGATRHERVIYTWPGGRIYIPEAVGYRLKLANGLTTIDGVLDVGADSFLVSLLSNLPPETNPGVASEPVPTLLASLLGIQNGVSKLELGDYVSFRSRGICALRNDSDVGMIFQSGVTSSLVSGQKDIPRRRFADFLQDSLARALKWFSKQTLTDSLKDNEIAEVEAFMISLMGAGGSGQRIADYVVDAKSGNTPEREAKNIFVIIVRVRLLPRGDFIVLQTEVGNNVVISNDV